MDAFWVWDFIFNIALPGIGLGLLGIVIWDALRYLFLWLKCRYAKDKNDNEGKEGKK